jgi:hypothetical protein
MAECGMHRTIVSLWRDGTRSQEFDRRDLIADAFNASS